MTRFFSTAFLLVLLSCNDKKQDNRFVVTGSVKNSSASTIYLQENPANAAPVIVDSTVLAKDGSFELEGSGVRESLYTLRSNDNPYPFAFVINDAKKITVNADLMNHTQPYTVKGSEASQGLIDFEKTSAQFAETIYASSRQVDSLLKAKAADSIVQVPFSQYETATSSYKSFASGFIEKANSPVLALYALGGFQRLSQQLGLKGFSSTEIAAIINGASARFPEDQALAALKKNQRSSQAPDFTLPDTTGTPVSLSSFKGKYVLVDFWASWCAPCRQENPNIVRAYNQFKDKNFTILGVSLDKSKEPWLEAIKKDNLMWTHVSDLKYWNSEAAALYQVRSIPYNVLLDPEGKIIAEDIRGAELHATLGKFLK